MALVTLTEAKDFLDVIHSSDDTKLQLLLDGAIDEACDYIGYTTPDDYQDYLDSSENPFGDTPSGFKVGVLLLLQANYQAPVDDIQKLRDAAEVKLFPYRIDFGI